MPELPEVETVCRGISPYLEHKTIKRVTLRRNNLRFAFAKDFCVRLNDQVVASVHRRGKYIVVGIVNHDYSLVWHLGMSGRVAILPLISLPKDYDKHDHVIFETSDGAQIRFRDPRRFGFMKIVKNRDIEQEINLGIEPFASDFNAEYLSKKFCKKSQAIKTALLDQKIIAGLGNIYVCEALFVAKIHPNTPAMQVSLQALHTLVQATRDILTKAIEAGGSSLRDHAQVNGETGYFQHQFKVYNRENELCLSCRKGMIRRIVQQGRSSFYCPVCQNNE